MKIWRILIAGVAVTVFGVVRRYKICRHCGKSVRTKETIEKI